MIEYYDNLFVTKMLLNTNTAIGTRKLTNPAERFIWPMLTIQIRFSNTECNVIYSFVRTLQLSAYITLVA